MKKIIVIGSGGAGKSTFSKRLGKILAIEVIHLDQLYWKAGWTETPKEVWAERVRGLLDGASWIMDGNFGGTRAMRMKACDTIILLDLPRRVCVYRVIKRAVIYRGRSRPDMAEGCNERIDLKFIAWVWNYRTKSRRRIFQEIENYPEKTFIVLRSQNEVSRFLRESEKLSTTVSKAYETTT